MTEVTLPARDGARQHPPSPGAPSADHRGPGEVTHRPRSPRGQGDLLRDDLLAAALQLLAETGDPEDVSIRGIAKAAGVSPTAAYRHFEDRDALIEAACETCFAEFSAHMLERVSGIDDPFERLQAAGQAYLDYSRNENGHFRVLFTNPAKDRLDFPTSADAAGTAFQQLVSLIEDCLAAGAKPSTRSDSLYLAFQVWTWVHGIAELHLSHPNQPWPDVDRMVADIAVALGLAGPG